MTYEQQMFFAVSLAIVSGGITVLAAATPLSALLHYFFEKPVLTLLLTLFGF